MMLTLRNLVTIVLALVLALPLQAQPHDDEESLIKHGIELRKQSRDADALVLFQRAFAVAHSPRAQAQVGLAEQALARWPEAVQALETALATSDSWIEQHRVVLEGALGVARSHVGRIALAGGSDGAAVTLDGAPAGNLPLPRPLAVAPGEHRVLVAKAGSQPFAGRVTLAAGQSLTLEVALQAEPLPAPPPVERSRKALWIGLGVGAAAAIALGVGLGVGLGHGKNFATQATASCHAPCMVVSF